MEFDGEICRTADLSLIYQLQKAPLPEPSALVHRTGTKLQPSGNSKFTMLTAGRDVRSCANLEQERRVARTD